MILSGQEILKQMMAGTIKIRPYNPKQLNPNSYNLRLAPDLLVYRKGLLDMASDNPVERITIPADGLTLWPGELYLAKTLEYTETDQFVPMLEGRSSVGRLGMFIHVTAGFGDVGFAGNWTLEITVTKPIKVYAGVEICQIYYHTIQGETDLKYKHGKYAGATDVEASKLWRDFE